MPAKKSDSTVATQQTEDVRVAALQWQQDQIEKGNQQSSLFTDSELREMSFEDILNSVPADEIGSSSDLGNGFELLGSDDKQQLVGLDMMVLEWTFRDGDMGVFASALILTKDGRRVIVNDGGTGICEQLAEYSRRTQSRKYLRVKGGLVRSDYPANDVRPAGTTYYLSTSA